MSKKYAELGSVCTALVLSTLVTATAPLAQAQQGYTEVQPSNTNDGKLKAIGIGAGIGALMAVGYYFVSDHGERSGKCGPWSCALPYLSISGGFAGLFMSRELAAQRRAERPRVGDRLVFASTNYEIPAAPIALGLRDSLLAVATDSGTQVISTASRSAALRRRGSGLSDVRRVAVSGGESQILIGTSSALWETGPTEGLLRRVLEGPVDALATSPTAVVAATGNSIRIRYGVGEDARTDSLAAPGRVTAAAWDEGSGNFWIATDSMLMELSISGSTPVLTPRVAISGTANAVASSANWVAVSLGNDGVAIWSRQALLGGGVTTPTVLRGEPRFAFDLAFLNDVLYVAGGVDGVTKIELSPSVRIVGSSRQAGYATSIASDGTALWIGDSFTGKTRIIRATP